MKKKKYEKEFNKKKFEDRRKVIEKYLDEVTVKLIDKTCKRKVYEIVIKLNYTVGEDRRSEFKLGVGVDNLKPTQNSHTPKQTPPIKGITKSPVRSMVIVIYNGFGLAPTFTEKPFYKTHPMVR